MASVALRGLFARKLRLALTVLAVVLGTTLIAGTYVFTDSINSAFDTIFTVSNKGTDAAITPHQTIDTTNNGGTPPTIAPRVLQQVRSSPGVASADGSVFDVGAVLGKDGKPITTGGSPMFIASVADQPRFEAFTVKTGHRPQNADQATIDAATADKEGFKLGGKVCAVATEQRDWPGCAARVRFGLLVEMDRCFASALANQLPFHRDTRLPGASLPRNDWRHFQKSVCAAAKWAFALPTFSQRLARLRKGNWTCSKFSTCRWRKRALN